MSEFARFAPLLKRRGFKKTYDSRAGGIRVVEWRKMVAPDRELDVQLWADGGHRMSHDRIGIDIRFRRQSTEPTPFTDEISLDAAITFETERQDSEPSITAISPSSETARDGEAGCTSTGAVQP